MDASELVEKAKTFAEEAHRTQVRNDGKKSPYILHVGEVADLVAQAGGTPQQVAAAWLHDTVEDTPTTLEDIEREFGGEVAELVHGLTDAPELGILPLAERKAKQAGRLLTESNTIKLVKLADQTSNVAIVGCGDLDWGLEKSFIYAEGAKKLAEVCRGVSPFLDQLFEERYQIALKNLEKLK